LCCVFGHSDDQCLKNASKGKIPHQQEAAHKQHDHGSKKMEKASGKKIATEPNQN